jgi:uncharacterized membrane protein YqjE
MTHIVLGLVGVTLGIVGLIVWWPTFGLVMRGAVPFTFLVVGFIAAASGVRRLMYTAPPRPGSRGRG